MSDGRQVQHEGNQNVHFGIRKDGALSFGYIPENTDLAAEFDQLVTGVVWLIRDGRNYIDVSKEIESSDTQETGE